MLEVSDRAIDQFLQMFTGDSRDRSGFDGMINKARKLREKRDPGLARLYKNVSRIVNADLFNFGAAAGYSVVRFELDGSNRGFRIREQDVIDFERGIINQIEERRKKNLGIVEDADRVLEASQISLTQVSNLGPKLTGFLASQEVVIRDLGLPVDHKTFYILGTLIMITPVVEKLDKIEP